MLAGVMLTGYLMCLGECWLASKLAVISSSWVSTLLRCAVLCCAMLASWQVCHARCEVSQWIVGKLTSPYPVLQLGKTGMSSLLCSAGSSGLAVIMANLHVSTRFKGFAGGCWKIRHLLRCSILLAIYSEPSSSLTATSRFYSKWLTDRPGESSGPWVFL